jgi:hypothetical protein
MLAITSGYQTVIREICQGFAGTNPVKVTCSLPILFRHKGQFKNKITFGALQNLLLLCQHLTMTRCRMVEWLVNNELGRCVRKNS